VSCVETNPGCIEQANASRRQILAILLAVTLGVEVFKYLALLPALQGWILPCGLFYYGLATVVPFVVARVAPGAASFEVRWLPRAWYHWAWFLGMIVLLRACATFSYWLTSWLGSRSLPDYTLVPVETITPLIVVLAGVQMVLVGPIAEEIFWRGYVLEQLRKLTWSGVALLIQSIAFALAHLHKGPAYAISAFLIGAVLGAWRIRFRSLIPLMLAHVFLNATACAPLLKLQFDLACSCAKPECREIERLTHEPVETAVPAIIGYCADPDEGVRNYAGAILTARYRGYAEPYLRQALVSGDKRALDEILSVVGMSRYSDLAQEVRDVVWSADDPHIQFSATMTLHEIGDVEGIRRVAQSHPRETVRKAAEKMLAWMTAED
jgi:membrane protease YdiL (CAAX protease family)